MQVFRGEAFIDAHMDKHHSAETDPLAQACLADLCGTLHCDFFASDRRGSVVHLRHAPCHTATLAVHKQRCQDVAHVCFPPTGGKAAQSLHAFMLANLCEAVTCRWKLCVP
jgi:hypothetical protein